MPPTVISALLLATLAAPAPAPPNVQVVEDVRGAQEFEFVIAPNAEPLLFHYVGSPENWPLEVRCSRRGEPEPFQVLDLPGDAHATCGDIVAPYRDADFFTAQDLNGDGFNDLRILAMWGATGTSMFFYYLWDPTHALFVRGQTSGDFGPTRPGCIRWPPNPSLQRTKPGRSPGLGR